MGKVQIRAEMVQAATSDDDDGTRLFRPAAYALVRNPILLIEWHLSYLLEQEALSWHSHGDNDPSLPSNEMRIKIGGNEGGGSFKMVFQIANQVKPNSADHTVVFCCLGADDNLPNLHIALDRFKETVHDVQQFASTCVCTLVCVCVTQAYGLKGS